MDQKPTKQRRRRNNGPEKKRGPKSPFNPSLGLGQKDGIKMPEKILKLLKEWPFKRLMNWMVMDANFKKKILDQVPEHDPPEPD